MDFLMDYNLEKSEKEILEACQKIEILAGGATSEQKALYLNYLSGLLNLKQQKKLLEEQSRANKKLVIATWALAGATILLAVVTAIITLCS
jgi:hypothetical protein